MNTIPYRGHPELRNQLYWLEGAGTVQGVSLTADTPLGYDVPREAGVHLESSFVSGRHGLFLVRDGGVLYEDLGSTNGTWYRDALLPPHTPIPLKDGDLLRIGEMEHPDDPRNVVLLFTTRGKEGERWQSFCPDPQTQVFEVGREQSALTLTDDTVSRSQCVLRRTVAGWAVENRADVNPTQLNGHMLDGRPAGLYPQDVVRMGNRYLIYDGQQFRFLAGGPERPFRPRSRVRPNGPSLEIHIRRRRVRQRLRHVDLLRDIRLTLHSGELVLILGGSGAGKTTFLHAVMGYEPAEGTIRYGERDVIRNYETMKYEIGYVPQEDLLRGGDTVWQTLRNAASLRLPRNFTKEEREQRVRETLMTFGLERERQQLVSKLSGGQRRRLSIAVEYIARPGLFFLDEPDSGLDGNMARRLMENLRGIADTGTIVMVISHGPDRAADLFDRVIVLARSQKENCGRLAFCGSPEETRSFFGTTSLEAVVRRVNRKDEGGEGLADAYIARWDARQGRKS